MSGDRERLRTSVRAVRERVAAALAGGEPPFADPAAFFGGLTGVAGPVAERLARLYMDVVDEIGDGGKLAVLVAAETAVAALDAGPADLSRLAVAVRVAGGTAAESIGRDASRLRSPEQLLLLIRSAARGPDELSDVLLGAFEVAGMDGAIEVVAGDEPGCEWTAGPPPGVEITVAVGGRGPGETAELYQRACRGLWAGRWATAEGVVDGGGAAYLRAADTLQAEADDDTVTAVAARAVIAGLEAPAGALAGRDGTELLDPLRVVQAVTRSGTAAAADLIES